MAVDTDFTSLLNNLKLEDPWLPPRTWESIPSESGLSVTSTSLSSPSTSRSLYQTSTVSEASLVRLAMNALQGLESSLTSIDKLCKVFHSDPTDRTFHRIPTLWNHSISTLSLEKILKSFGCTGSEVYFLNKFISHFTNINWDDDSTLKSTNEAESASSYPPYSLVNQAFAVAVRDVLEGYIAALDTLSSSVSLRRLSNNENISTSTSGCLSSVGNSEITLLEVYLHTKELRTQIEIIGSICNVHNVAVRFSLSPLEDLNSQTKFSEFPRGGDLLTYLYMELQVADPVHCALLKTLFIRSCEPYFDFIRSWIFKAKITDPFNEFIVAETVNEQSFSPSNTGATIREEDGVSVPCFLKDLLIPLFRAGEQLQVLIKLLDFSDGVVCWNSSYEDFLPYWSKMSNSRLSHAFHMDFSKKGIEEIVVARKEYYRIMMEKLENHLPNLEFKYHQVISYSTLPISGSNEKSFFHSAKNLNQNLPLDTVECDESSMTEDLSYMEESSECSSVENYSEENIDAFDNTVDFSHDSEELEQKYLSALEINSNSSHNIHLKSPSQGENPSTAGNGLYELSENADLSDCSLPPQHSWMNMSSVPSWNPSCMMETQFSNDQISKYPIYNTIGNISDTLLNTVSHKSKIDLIPGTKKLRERNSKICLPSFDFKSVKDPFTECVDKLNISHELLVSDSNNMKNHHKKFNNGDVIVKKNSFHSHTHASTDLKTDHQKQSVLPNVTGGGCWENLLDEKVKKNDNNNNNNIRPVEHKTTMAAAGIEIPLDFVLERCLLEEIQLQYMYVSKLTIKLLEEGFSLQEHLLALRRYHMMESADWADLFIMSLSHHKWYATEADKGISEIQGLLELSVQRSSCEKDRFKDKLFVYMKEQDSSSSLPGFATGIQSFNVLGLGYRVDWPVSIVLTPVALKMYAQIFSFLIKVKLAFSSLTQVWCSFKEFVHDSNLRKSKSRNFNIMVKLRHQIFHFVSTLQQYVQSQLSYVSWGRFLQSLKHKVKDLTDLDFVHMDYLNDSQHICFLSNDMKHMSDIIQSILQCALDFRSVVSSGGGLTNVTQVLTIKETFEQNMKQLYACYLKSPKNVEFSLPRFWEYLDYNRHYSDIIDKQNGHHIFS